MSRVTPNDVLHFWFNPEHDSLLFAVNEEFDQQIRTLFYDTWLDACQGLLCHWRTNSRGRLAEIIVLDQFSRNLNRGSSKSFMQDPMALVLAQELVKNEDLSDFTVREKQFAYLPFMHSENVDIQKISLQLFSDPLMERPFKYAKEHKETIDKFGRFPHRNSLLNRPSTPEELDYLSK